MGLKFLLFTNQQQHRSSHGGRKIMEGSGDGSPQSSMCMVKAAELFPKPVLEKEEESLTARFTYLDGESVRYLGQTDDGILALSNYRLFLQKSSTGAEVSVPLGLIESTQVRDLFHLIVNCKDASTVKCSFSTSEQCSEWHRRISLSIGVPETLEALFAFPFHAWASESPTLNQDNEWAGRLQRDGSLDDDFRREAERLQFDLQGAWRISQANADFKLCPSYPRLLLVPACISDDTLQNVASFRSSRRIPAVVWRHQRTGAVIARCSQPEVGWLGWRNSKDEQLLKALSDACSFDRGTQDRASDGTRRTTTTRTRHSSEASSENSPPASPEGSHEEVEMDEPKKILIVDARSYTSAVTNRARGGGCECAEYYPSAEIQFMSLGNIHVIRKSFHALRQLCASQADIPNWLGLLERTLWLQHLSGLLAASMVVCHAIERSGRPVLVHCSDGWDRTPQIVATAQLCLDPYYRTIEGFRVLVEREWLNFGHKFADRCGHGPGSDETNERCPVFLQWLDCVHQIHRQFPCSFEFDMGYLIKLAQHSHSCLFGTFLCNTVKERQENSVPDRTFSVWPFLSGPIYKNHLYMPNRERVLWPAHNVRDLRLWTEVYLGSWGGGQQQANPSEDYQGAVGSASTMTTVQVSASNGSDNAPTGADINGPVVNGTTVSGAPVIQATGQELNGSMTKTRSYSDIKEATNSVAGGVGIGVLARRSSDPSMSVDPSSILSGTSGCALKHLAQQEDSLNDSNFSSDRETSPHPLLLDEHPSGILLHHEMTSSLAASSFSIQHATQKLQSLTRELNQSDEELESTIIGKRPAMAITKATDGDLPATPSTTSSSLFANGGGLDGIVSMAASAAAATIIPTATTVTATESSYRFQPIVPELPTVPVVRRGSGTTSLPDSPVPLPSLAGPLQQQRLSFDDIDENTSRIIKIENYRTTIGYDIPDGGGGGGGGGVVGGLGIRTTVGRPVTNESDLMMESVDLSSSSGSSFVGGPLAAELPSASVTFEQSAWHGSIETSTDTLVPIDQYQPLATQTLSDVADEEVRYVHESWRKESLDAAELCSTEAVSSGRTGGSVRRVSGERLMANGEFGATVASKDGSTGGGSYYTAKTQTDDSNGCDFNSDSQQHYDRKLSNQSSSLFTARSYNASSSTVPNDQPEYPVDKHIIEDRTSGGDSTMLRSTAAHITNGSSTAGACKPKTNTASVRPTPPSMLSSMMMMDESIFIQPQFQQLEINGVGKHHQPANADDVCRAGSMLQQQQKERRRRNSSNSKADLMSPNKPTNGSISPSATHSRFSTPGARSLPLTPPSVPYAADRPPVATFSCPDGLAHALSEQNLRLQQIVYEHRLREEALQRELYATRLALLKKTCQHCCSSVQQHYGNDDPVPVNLSITSVASNFTASTITTTGCDGDGGEARSNSTSVSTTTASRTLCCCVAASSSLLTPSLNALSLWHQSVEGLIGQDNCRKHCHEPLSLGRMAVSPEMTESIVDRASLRELIMFTDDDDETGEKDEVEQRNIGTSPTGVLRKHQQRQRQPSWKDNETTPSSATDSDADAGDISSAEDEEEAVGAESRGVVGRRFGASVSRIGSVDGFVDELSSQLMVDSMNENASNCSWEAVDDRSAPSSGANSSQQMQYSSSGVGSTSVLWVPDHAVTRCTSCQTEFSLCRRKHHCRSCGQIFCAECSEFSAHLPDDRFYQPVRLCGPCYQRISIITAMPAPVSSSSSSSGQMQTTSAAITASNITNNGAMNGGSIIAGGFPRSFGGPPLVMAANSSTAVNPLHSLVAECKHHVAINGVGSVGEGSRVGENCCKTNATATASN
ncbi:myotubularin-related protein 4 [Anopheles bellator]|uniref:myotubularin-related protein 4 n=1 Tax=Anopheles bellator TaxID=139047 RepID=UPI002649AEE4|nr:myotubularin-related protein 4 [Anopheles bellator]